MQIRIIEIAKATIRILFILRLPSRVIVGYTRLSASCADCTSIAGFFSVNDFGAQVRCRSGELIHRKGPREKTQIEDVRLVDMVSFASFYLLITPQAMRSPELPEGSVF